MGAKGSVEAAKLNADNWGHLEVCMSLSSPFDFPDDFWTRRTHTHN